MAINSILPPHFSELELALDHAYGSRLAELRHIDLWDAWSCPAEFLTLLAWQESVDHWQEEWPDHIKRQVIAAAPELHRIKGTKQAVLNALAALNIDADYSEWHENGGEPGTFKIVAYLRDNLDVNGNTLLTEQAVNQLIALVNGVKRGSQHYTLKTGIHQDATLAMAATTAGAINQTNTGTQTLSSRTPTGALAMAAVSAGSITVSQVST